MIVTIDTNVMYQALRSCKGASHYILQLVRAGNFQIAISNATFYEYEDVLTRPESLTAFEMEKKDIIKFLRYIAYIGEKYDPRYLFRPNLKDESDNMFIELAIVSNSRYLITSNIKDYKSGDLLINNFKLATPTQFAIDWRKKND